MASSGYARCQRRSLAGLASYHANPRHDSAPGRQISCMWPRHSSSVWMPLQLRPAAAQTSTGCGFESQLSGSSGTGTISVLPATVVRPSSVTMNVAARDGSVLQMPQQLGIIPGGFTRRAHAPGGEGVFQAGNRRKRIAEQPNVQLALSGFNKAVESGVETRIVVVLYTAVLPEWYPSPGSWLRSPAADRD